MQQPLLTACLFLPFAGAACAPGLVALFGHRAAWLLAVFLLVPFVVFAGQLETISAGQAVAGGFAWAPSVGLDYAFRLDGLGLAFALLISGIGTLIVLYSGAYMKEHPGLGRFLAFILLFSAAMLGVVVADNLLMLFVYWELTSIASFLLIGFDRDREAARRAAFQALVVTGGGGLAFLAGLLLLRGMTGATTLSGAMAAAAIVSADPLANAALVLILIGAFTKSAQVPFHSWLPNAMQAPTPVSAFLHSATMVKAGVYLLMRLYPLFSGFALWQWALPLIGGLTLLTGAVLALGEKDLKLMLAQTTVASLGLMVMLTGLGSDRAVEAAVLYLLAHAFFKGALFMLAGVIDHAAGSRDITALGGLGRSMPVTLAATALAALSMAGLPFLAGFYAKEEIYAAALGSATASLVLGVALLGNALMGAIAISILVRPFFGTLRPTPGHHPHDGPPGLMAGPVLLALAGLAAGLLPALFLPLLATPMASAILGHPSHLALAVLPHWGGPLAASALTIALALLGFWQMAPLRGATARLVAFLPSLDRGFDAAISGLVALSVRIHRLLQPGSLERYLTVTFAAIALCLLLPLVAYDGLPSWPGFAAMRFHEAALMAIATIGLVAVLVARSRLTAIVSLGIQGFAVAMLYLLYGAPDLSFTQFMVETLSVVILALIMTRLRLDVTDHRAPSQILLDATIAMAAGLGFALVLMRSIEQPFDASLSAFFGAYSKLVAHGANVVNVIIVDFRGTDTLGEIAVVVITGLAIRALIRLRAAPASAVFNDPDAEEERAP